MSTHDISKPDATTVESEAESESESETDIFQERTHLKPYEYPELQEYINAIRDSHWTHREFNFEGDVQDYHANATDTEQVIIKRAMLAISQIEVQVKTFWSDVADDFPKPEIHGVGSTFSESEVRHMDSYSALLDELGIQDEFEDVTEVPAIQSRIEYLDTYLTMTESRDKKERIMGVLMFSTFVEHVSLFSQFLIMTSFDKHEKRFKRIANVVEATSKEEQIHGLFGQRLVEIVREENPDLFDDSFEATITEATQEAYAAESEIIDWIYAEGELDFLPRAHIDAFLKRRFNDSLDNAGFDPVFDVDDDLADETRWFKEDLMLSKDNDFFDKEPTAYSKNTQSVTADDMF